MKDIEKTARQEAIYGLIEAHQPEFRERFTAALQRLRSGGRHLTPVYRRAAVTRQFQVAVCARKNGGVDVVSVHTPDCIHTHYDGETSGQREWYVRTVPADHLVGYVVSLLGPSVRKRFGCGKCGGSPALRKLYPTER